MRGGKPAPAVRALLSACCGGLRSPALAWVLLPTAAGVLFVYWAHGPGGRPGWIAKAPHEAAAVVLMGMTTALFAARSLAFRRRVDYLLTIAAMNFWAREIHFAGTDTAVVVVAVVVAALACVWRLAAAAELVEAPRQRLALAAAAATYLAALLVQRRVFRADRLPLLPQEDLLHVPLEEVLENAAHLCFLLAAVAGRWRPAPRSGPQN